VLIRELEDQNPTTRRNKYERNGVTTSPYFIIAAGRIGQISLVSDSMHELQLGSELSSNIYARAFKY
jgi:hypothetical protein